MKLGERLKALIGTIYAAYQGLVGPAPGGRIADHQLTREQIEERERQKALRELDRLRNQPPQH